MRWNLELTDTFGGEANYSWVNRFIVSASSPRGAMRKVCNVTRDTVRDSGCERWDSTGGGVCYFIEQVDAEMAQSMKDNYSRIEVL